MMKQKHLYIILVSLLWISCGNEDPVPDPEPGTGVDKTVDCKSPQEIGAYTTFFKPLNGFVGDPMPFFNAADQTFYLFFLYENQNNHPIYVEKTKDYASFEGFAEAIPAGNGIEEWLGTGSFADKDGKYYCFYTGHNGNLSPAEKVMLATSSDLKTWTKQPAFSMEAPSGFDKNNFRDPCVYFDETRNSYVMLVSSRFGSNAALARYTSTDLSSWTQITSLLAGTDIDTDAEIIECPDMFKMGSKWYLIFSRINRDAHRKTFYRIADSPDGPWRICGDKSKNEHHETFDGLYLYAGKSASDGEKRYLSGWCSTGQEVNSNKELDWAGSLITHQLIQQPDGRLYPAIPEAADSKFRQAVEYAKIKQEGNVTENAGTYTLTAENNPSIAVFSRNTESVKITMTIDAAQSNRFGIAFGACGNQGDAYSLTFDLTDNHYGLPAVFFYKNQKELNFTPLIVPSNKIFDVKIIIEKSVCVMYVNGNVAFTNRISSMNQNPWMIFANEGTVKFSAIKIFN
jgi:beta-fructofuranosidase